MWERHGVRSYCAPRSSLEAVQAAREVAGKRLKSNLLQELTCDFSFYHYMLHSYSITQVV